MVTQGSIIFIDFNPHSGHEQAGKRPAVVISNNLFNRVNNMTMVCPITSSRQKTPFQIPLDDRTMTHGVILCDQVRMLDLNIRGYDFCENIPTDVLEEVLDVIKGIMEI